MKKHVYLNNNIKIPSIGFGTWQTPDGDIAATIIKNAIKKVTDI